MRDFINSLRDVVEGSIGTCPRCMRAAFISAFCASVAAVAVMLSIDLSGGMLILLWSLPAALTALWLAHAWMFSRRALANGSETVRHRATAAPMPRRQFLTLFGRSLAFSALAGAL